MRPAEHLLFIKEIADTLNITPPYIKYLRNQGIDMQKLCRIFTDERLYIRSKRNYLYALPNISENDKDHIWEAFMGDAGIMVTKHA